MFVQVQHVPAYNSDNTHSVTLVSERAPLMDYRFVFRVHTLKYALEKAQALAEEIGCRVEVVDNL
jgi:hypothetical protein